MGWVLLILLILLLATGALWAVLKAALAVALGVFLAVVLIAAYAGWRFRKAVRSAQARQAVRPPTQTPRQIPGSTVEVIDPEHRAD